MSVAVWLLLTAAALAVTSVWTRRDLRQLEERSALVLARRLVDAATARSGVRFCSSPPGPGDTRSREAAS